MEMRKRCPRCNSTRVKLVNYHGIRCMVCQSCGYDEREEYEVVPEQRTSQKAKARYSPYKAGGKHRAKKRG